MSVGKCCVRWGVGAAPETVRTGPLTEEELASLGLKFTCDGCGRPEASVVTKSCHHEGEHRCQHCNFITKWERKLQDHVEKPCPFAPTKRTRDSVAGRILARQDKADKQTEFPPVMMTRGFHPYLQPSQVW